MKLLLAAAAALVGLAVPVLGHGDLSSSKPENNGLLEAPPSAVVLNFAEEPSEATIRVTDGCRRNVVEDVDLAGSRATVSLASTREPGHYRVRYRNVSSVDGHAISGRFAFHVLGKKNCRAETEEPDADGDQAAPPEAPGDDSSFPVVPVALGTVGVVGVALLVRLATRS